MLTARLAAYNWQILGVSGAKRISVDMEKMIDNWVVRGHKSLKLTFPQLLWITLSKTGDDFPRRRIL